MVYIFPKKLNQTKPFKKRLFSLEFRPSHDPQAAINNNSLKGSRERDAFSPAGRNTSKVHGMRSCTASHVAVMDAGPVEIYY